MPPGIFQQPRVDCTLLCKGGEGREESLPVTAVGDLGPARRSLQDPTRMLHREQTYRHSGLRGRKERVGYMERVT